LWYVCKIWEKVERPIDWRENTSDWLKTHLAQSNFSF
jgi:hypothetical protein